MPQSPQVPQDLETYVDHLSVLLDLPLHPDHRPGVLENLYRIQAIAQVFLDFPLPDDVDVAPVFQP